MTKGYLSLDAEDRAMKKLLLVCATALLVGGLSAPQAQANPFKVTITQDGSNVVASGSGSIDISGLTLLGGGAPSNSMDANFFTLVLGASAADAYAVTFLGDQGLDGFGDGGTSFASDASGDTAGLFILTNDQGQFTDPLFGQLYVPAHYVSDGYLSDTTTWDNFTFASLGLTPGTYSMAWGNAPNQSFTVVVQAGVPEPSSLALLGAGLLGMFLLRFRKSS
jgi:PEP-CTERM motif